MRTVEEIVEAVQEQQLVSEDELRLALLCLFYDGYMACPSDYAGRSELALRVQAKDNFQRRFRMLRTNPREYLGSRWTPGTPENRVNRAMSKRVLASFEAHRAKKELK